MSVSSAADVYAQRGFHRVHGWLTTQAVSLIVQIAKAQDLNGIRGPVCEIGVHHGKLFTLLHLLEREYVAGGIDLFEAQAANLDGSGYGDRDRLLTNVGEHGGDLSRIRLLATNSQQIATQDIVTLCEGRPRLFSVDGGHTAECTYNDLNLAAESTAERGVVILDDYFNPAWPGVAEGTSQFLHDHPGALLLVAVGGNKIIFAKSDSRSYANVCRELAATLKPTLRERIARSPLRRHMRNWLGR